MKNNEHYVMNYLKQRVNNYPNKPINIYRNLVYGPKHSINGEIDYIVEYDNYFLIFEIKAGEKYRRHATSQLERAEFKGEING